MVATTVAMAGQAPAIGILRRNSTASQRDNYRALEQFDFLAKKVRDRGAEPRFYDEQATSGRSMAKRTTTLAMLDDLRNGRLQGIAFYDVSRGTRDPDGFDILTYKRACREAKALLITASREYDFRDSTDSMVFSLEGVIAAREWEETRRRTWTGLLKRAEMVSDTGDAFVRGRSVPVGYRRVTKESNGKRVIAKDPDQASLMEELRASLDRHDSIYAVCKDLNERGLTPPGRANGWRHRALTTILASPIYYGDWSFGYARQESDVWTAQWAQGRQLTHHIPDLAYWDRGQVMYWRQKFSTPAWHGRERKNTYLYSGLLRCPGCGNRLIAGWSGRAHRPLYRCPDTNQRPGAGRCSKAVYLYEDKVSSALGGILPGLLTSFNADAEVRATGDVPKSDIELRIDHLRREEAIVNSMIDATLQAALAEGVTITPPQNLITRLARLQIDKEQAEIERHKEQADRAGRDAALRVSESIQSDAAIEGFNDLSDAEQVEVYRLLLSWISMVPTASRGQKFKPYQIVAYRSRIQPSATIVDEQYLFMERLPWWTDDKEAQSWNTPAAIEMLDVLLVGR